MAEEGSVYELEGFEKQLQSLLTRYSSDELRGNSKLFCSDFCKLVEEYASRGQVPLPQLRILEISLCYFARACTFFPSNCDHVLHTLSSLALSLFELLLFFDQKDFHQEPLKQFTLTFQECHQLALGRLQNVHLLQVERLVRGGGPWAVPALQAILSESNLPQSEVDGCISSEMPVFFELRVHYLLSCERVSEAMALAKCCARNPTAGQHLFFLQVYLTWLFKTSQHDRLHKEVAELNGKDAIHIICSLECEEKDELLLALSRAFLSQQLRKGDMYYLCDLVFIWSKLHSRLNTSKNALLGESRQLMLSATNVNSIFPFIRAILKVLGEDGIQFCVELCANALGSCLPCDVITKSLIYKTIAGLLPDDLEVCRACALLVFFLERTVEAYKMVYLLYMHPDQEYHVEHSPIRNHVRFETLQVLKKDLYFDPEFWNLIALRTNCLKLMSEKVVSGALEEIMEDKWILSYCTKEVASQLSTPVCQKGSKDTAARKRNHKEDRHHKADTDTASKRLKLPSLRQRH
ncbi:zinc finger protein 292-like [Etheostoma cragini]|uniref:zinc finger protein 292-like n=1 Tax=Etheostoma cragini TaxID=417921 RepID=UPI00155DE11B|nr:zinc finger protein 292-like [Etheostoma cragini]